MSVLKCRFSKLCSTTVWFSTSTEVLNSKKLGMETSGLYPVCLLLLDYFTYFTELAHPTKRSTSGFVEDFFAVCRLAPSKKPFCHRWCFFAFLRPSLRGKSHIACHSSCACTRKNYVWFIDLLKDKGCIETKPRKILIGKAQRHK